MADPIRTTQRGSAQVIESRVDFLRMLLVLGVGLSVLAAAPDWMRPFIERVRMAATSEIIATAPVEPSATAQRAGNAPPVVAAKQSVLSEFLAKRYRVSRKVIEDFVAHAFAAAQVTKIDPLLILAVMAVESGFNPIAESVMGAKGLMQVIPEYHPEKFVTRDGEVNVLDPATNILAGAKVLREYSARTDNDLVATLGLYGGIGPTQENFYATRVLSERERLEQIVRRMPHLSSAVRGS